MPSGKLPPIYPVQCKVCEYQWYPRSPTEKPRICPQCKSVRWDVGRRYQRRPKPDAPQARALVPA
jgi:predicted Zn-ribbon and HTH transcriptional regulator